MFEPCVNAPTSRAVDRIFLGLASRRANYPDPQPLLWLINRRQQNNALWSTFAEMMCPRSGYDKIASAVSGTDATDAACKIARKWTILKKGVVPENLMILRV